MSNYKDFVSDYPARCRDLLVSMEAEAAVQGREVTFMLAIASTGFIFPYERLKGGNASQDRNSFPDSTKAIEDIKKESFLRSPLSEGLGHTWRLGEVTYDHLRHRPDAWPGFSSAERISQTEPACSILQTLRNALAHANIWTTATDPIDTIVFATRKNYREEKGDYKYVAASPKALRDFLIAWFKFLATKRIPVQDAQRALVLEAA